MHSSVGRPEGRAAREIDGQRVHGKQTEEGEKPSTLEETLRAWAAITSNEQGVVSNEQ